MSETKLEEVKKLPVFKYENGREVPVVQINPGTSCYRITGYSGRNTSGKMRYALSIIVTDYDLARQGDKTVIVSGRLKTGTNGLAKGTYVPLQYDKATGYWDVVMEGLQNKERITNESFN